MREVGSPSGGAFESNTGAETLAASGETLARWLNCSCQEGGEEIKDEGERRASDGTRGVQDGGMLGKRKEREDVEGQNVRREKRAESERGERG